MLEPIEAKVPVRTPVQLEPIEAPKAGQGESRFAPLAAFFGSLSSGPIFSRLGDIMAANMGAMLDRAEDPARMIRMIILEMEETLVEIRASAARTVADVKELRCDIRRLQSMQADWSDKASLALEKDRDDLARAALVEGRKAAAAAQALESELETAENTLKAYELDIAKLQGKLNEARGRQHAIAHRFDRAVVRGRTAELLNGGRTQDAFAQFDVLERRADWAESKAEALGLAQEDELASLQADAAVEAELEAMKAALGRRLN
jgi:phage shock protein A